VQLPDGTYAIRYNSEDLAGNIAPTRTFDMVSCKLYDAGKLDKVTINGVVKDLTNNAWSDVNFIKP